VVELLLSLQLPCLGCYLIVESSKCRKQN
jgi:hypothetical protein